MKKQQPVLVLLLEATRRFLSDEAGDDLVEYALLTSSVAIASVAGLGLLSAAIGSTYSSWDTGVNSLWQSPNP